MEVQKYKYISLIAITLLHIYAIICLYVFITNINLKLFLWFVFTSSIAGFGVTAGVHRYWSHKSYKTKNFMKIILSLCFSMAGQNTIFEWVRDHRVHHAFTETTADPHDSRRGFMFSHVGWLMMTKHPDVIEKGKKIYLKDILDDPIVKWHTKYFSILKFLFCFLIPISVPMIFWNENFNVSVSSQMLRYVLVLNATWSVNSIAHMWGNRPYDKNISPRENIFVSIFAMGEGYHNYHHVYPWDYKASEFGFFNITTKILNFLKFLGVVYDVRSVDIKSINK